MDEQKAMCPITAVQREGYPAALPLLGEGLSCHQLLARLAAMGVTPLPALTLADMVLVARTSVRTVRSCSIARYTHISVEATCIVALLSSEARLASDRVVREEQIGPAAAYTALLDLNHHRLRQQLALARLRRRLKLRQRLVRLRRHRRSQGV